MAAGLERARRFSWAETARRTLGGLPGARCERRRRRRRRHARAATRARPCLAALAPSGRRARRRREPAGARTARREADRQRAAARVRGQREQGDRRDERPVRRRREPGHRAARGRGRGSSSSSPRASARRGDRPAARCFRTAAGSRRAAASPPSAGTIVRRTPLRTILRPGTRQRDHYLLEERPTEPVQADWMLAAFLLLRREMLDELGGFDEGYRLYGEDIDLCYRAAKAGWERWYVPQATVAARARRSHGPPVPHAADSLALALDREVCAQAPRTITQHLGVNLTAMEDELRSAWTRPSPRRRTPSSTRVPGRPGLDAQQDRLARAAGHARARVRLRDRLHDRGAQGPARLHRRRDRDRS